MPLVHVDGGADRGVTEIDGDAVTVHEIETELPGEAVCVGVADGDLELENEGGVEGDEDCNIQMYGRARGERNSRHVGHAARY